MLNPLGNEIDVVVNVDVNSGHVFVGAVDAPGHEANDVEEAGVGLADKRGSTVTLACVLTFLTTGAPVVLILIEINFSIKLYNYFYN